MTEIKTILALRKVKRWLWNNSIKRKQGKRIEQILIDREVFDELFEMVEKSVTQP